MSKTVAKSVPAPISAAKATAPVSLSPLVVAPDLHGHGEAVETAAAKLFGIGSDAIEAPSVESETVSDGAQVEETAEAAVEANSEAETAVEAPAEAGKAPDLEKLRQIALEKAKTREQKGAEASKNRELEARIAQIESQAAADRQAADAFRQLQQMGKKDPIALIEALGMDPVPFVQSAHRQAVNREGFTVQQKLDAALAKIAELEGTVQEIPRQQQAQARASVNETARREFIAITSAEDTFPLLAIEPPEVRLNLAQEMANILMEAEEEVTHARVAELAEAHLRSEAEKRAAALSRVKTGSSPQASAQAGGATASPGRPAGHGRPSPKTLSNSLAAEAPAAREKTPQERERAAAAIAGRIFGKPL